MVASFTRLRLEIADDGFTFDVGLAGRTEAPAEPNRRRRARLDSRPAAYFHANATKSARKRKRKVVR